MIDIKLLTKELLAKFIDDPAFYTSEFIPITQHRAFSHIQNPRLEEHDILLLLAYKENTLVGYLGVLPDKIYIKNEFQKCGWLSCLWINPAYRGQKIAQLLVEKGMEVWEGRILATEFTAVAKKLYNKTNFFTDLQIKKGIRLYTRLDLYNILPPRKEIFKKFSFFLKIADTLVNSVLGKRFLFWKTNITKLHLEYINHLDAEVENFISDGQYHQLFRRGKNELNWMLQNPWILSAPIKDFMSSKYHFTSSDQSFNFYALKVRNLNNELIAFLIFSKRNETMKLPYCYYKSDELKTVIEVIYVHILKWKIKTFSTFHNDIVDYLSNHRTPALLKRSIRRHYLISKKIYESGEPVALEIQDGDGDCGFT